MPFKRRRPTSSSRYPKRARLLRRRSSARQLRRPIRGSKYGFRIQPHLFHRWMTAFPSANVNVLNGTYDTSVSVFSTNTLSATSSMSMFFTLADIPNIGEFTTLFDFYKLNRVLVTIKLVPPPEATNYPQLGSGGNAANWYPTIWYVRDNDDHNTQTLSQIKEFEKVKHRVLQPNRELKIILRPTTISQVYKTALSSGYQIDMKKQYLDMADTTVPHYGLKTVFDLEGLTSSSSSSQQFQFKINCKYFFSCKNVR